MRGHEKDRGDDAPALSLLAVRSVAHRTLRRSGHAVELSYRVRGLEALREAQDLDVEPSELVKVG